MNWLVLVYSPQIHRPICDNNWEHRVIFYLLSFQVCKMWSRVKVTSPVSHSYIYISLLFFFLMAIQIFRYICTIMQCKDIIVFSENQVANSVLNSQRGDYFINSYIQTGNSVSEIWLCSNYRIFIVIIQYINCYSECAGCRIHRVYKTKCICFSSKNFILIPVTRQL